MLVYSILLVDRHRKYLIIAVMISIPAGLMDNALYAIFIAPLISEPSLNPETVMEEISLPIVNVASAHDQVTIKLFGPDGNLKDIQIIS